MSPARFWTSLLVGCCLSAPALAQAPVEGATASAVEPELDDKARAKAREKALFILGRHITAVGGEDAIRATEFITITGTFEILGAPFLGRVTSMRGEPPRLMTRLEFGQAGTLLQGFDGRVAWTIHPTTGPAVLEGTERISMIRSADVHGDLNYEQTYTTIEFLGDDTFEEEPVFAVRLVDHDTTETTEYFSKGSGLRLGIRGVRETESGPIPYTRALSEYVEYEGLKVPTISIERVGQQVISVTIEDVSFSAIDPSVFDLPEEVRALIEAQPDDEKPPETP